MLDHLTKMFFTLTTLLLFLRFVLGDLTCARFVPPGSNGNVGQFQFAGQQSEDFIPSTNATVGNPVFLNTKAGHRQGTTFHFQSCNSTSLNFSSYSVDRNCSVDDDCFRTYYNFVRIINPVSGHCLTNRALPKKGVTELYPTLCDGNPSTGAQIFPTSKIAFYTANYGSLEFYGDTFVWPYGSRVDYTQSISPWVIGSDNRTVYYVSPQPQKGSRENSLIAIFSIG